jgi:hypothetical protein
MGKTPPKPFVPQVARRVVEAAKEQPNPTRELKTALEDFMSVTRDPERVDGETTCAETVSEDRA